MAATFGRTRLEDDKPPLAAFGMLAASAGAAWLARLDVRTGYAAGVLGPSVQAGIGLGMVIAPVINTGTFGMAEGAGGERVR